MVPFKLMWRRTNATAKVSVPSAGLVKLNSNLGSTDAQSTQISEPLIKWMFTLGIVCIAITWTSIPIIFAWQGKLDDLLDILRRGTVMRFVTVTYIVLVVVTLALVGRMDGDKVSTILASIAGYVLGQTTHSVHKEKGIGSDGSEPAEGDQAS